jgi:hypothetical protein
MRDARRTSYSVSVKNMKITSVPREEYDIISESRSNARNIVGKRWKFQKLTPTSGKIAVSRISNAIFVEVYYRECISIITFRSVNR